MAKLTLNNIGSRYGSIDALNDNSDLIEAAFENTLSRDGTGPNNMEADLDMDSNSIINVANLSAGSLIIGGLPVSPGNINYTGQIKETQIATLGQTVFNLSSISYNPLTNNLSVYVDGVYQNPSRYTETNSTRVTFSTGLHVGAVVDFAVLSLNDLGGTTDAANVTYTPAGGGTPTTVAAKLQQYVSVKDFGAVGDGVTNETAAFAAARAVTDRYYIPTGTYVLDASPDPFLDCFTAGSGVTLIVGGVSYNCSNAFAGPLRYRAASASKTDIIHAKTGNIVMFLQDGSPGTATTFNRTIKVVNNSHFLMAQPATNGGSCDLLFQRSTLNADPAGNRFNITFEESADRLLYSYATSASGSPSFDSYLEVIGGTSPSLRMPALPLMLNQGWKIQTRAGGALRLAYVPTTATTATLTDETTGNVLERVTRSRQAIAGINFDTLYDTPTGITGPQQWGGVFGDLVSGGALPITRNLWNTTGATRNFVAGRMIISAQPSGATGSCRIARFTFDGTTVTITDETNTLPVQVVATIALSGTNLQFQASYAGGLGGGCTLTVMIEWSGSGR